MGSRREHEGRIKQPGVPRGPRNTAPGRSTREHEGRTPQPGVPQGPRNSTTDVSVPYAPTPKGKKAEHKAKATKAAKKEAKANARVRAILRDTTSPTEAVKKIAPRAYHQAKVSEEKARQRVIKQHGENLGEPEDITHAIEIASAATGAGALAKGIVKGGEEVGARLLAKDAAGQAGSLKGDAKALLNKAGGKIKGGVKETPKRVKSAPKRAKTAAKGKVSDTKLRYSKTGRKVTRRNRSVKVASYGPAATATGAGVGGLGVLGADAEGTLKADPREAIPRTLEIAPGLIVSTADLGAQTIKAIATGDTSGLKKRIAEEFQSNKKLAETYASGNPERVKKFTEEQGYVGPLMAAGPLAKLGRVGRDAAIARRAPGDAIDEAIDQHVHGDKNDLSGKSAAGRARARQKRRKQTARAASRERAIAQHEVHDAGRPIAKEYTGSMRRKGVKGRRKIKNKTVDRGDAAPLFAEEGLTPKATPEAWAKVAKKWEGRPEAPSKKKGGVTGHDVVSLVESDPGIWDDKAFWRTVEKYRAQEPAVRISERVPDLEQAKTHGVQQIDERIPQGARPLVKDENVHSRADVQNFIGKGGEGAKRVTRLRETIRSAENKARQLRGELKQIEKADRLEGRRNAMTPQELSQHRRLLKRRSKQLLDVEADVRGMRAELESTRSRHDAIKEALRSPEEAAALKHEFDQELEAVQRDHGITRGAYVPHTDVAREGLGVEPSFVRAGKKIHTRSTGGDSLAERGRVNYSLPEIIQHGVAAPRIRSGIHRFVKAETEDGALRIPVKTKDGRTELRRLVTREEAERGLTEDQKAQVSLFPANQFKQAVTDRNLDGMEKALGSLGHEIDWRADDKGQKYIVLDKDHAKEILAQVSAPGKGLHLLQIGSRGISRAILASPAWAIAQVFAEGLQAAHTVNPLNPATYYHFVQGVKGFRGMSEAERREFRAKAGETAMGGSPRDWFTADGRTQSGLVDRFNRLERVLPLKHLMQAVKLDWLNAIDRYKGGKIRLGVSIIKAHREAYGLGAKLERLVKNERELSARLAKMSPDDRLRWAMGDHGKLENQVADMLGDWRSLTRKEKVASPALIFYPFLRMSLQWPFYSLPKHHPVLASIMYDVAHSHNEQLREILGGPPSWFGEYATAILYNDENAKDATLVKASRIVPGANAIVEAVGAGEANVLNRGLNPVVSFYNALINGIDPMTGEQIDTAGMSAEEKMIARMGLTASVLMNTNPEARAVDQLKGSKESTSLPIVGGRREKDSLGDLLEKLNGSPSEKALTTMFNPFPSTDAGTAQDRQIMSNIFGVWRQFGADAQSKVEGEKTRSIKSRQREIEHMKDREQEAYDELDHLYQKYGITGYRAEEKRGLKEYEAFTYGSSSEKSDTQYGGSGQYGGSSQYSTSGQYGSSGQYGG